MKCYQCGADLTVHDFCTNCGADVARYKIIMGAANLYYNEGLEKANVRDLSGAIVSLRQCLKLNKNHVEARNLLGLIYFEMGEAVVAMSEWVISKNLRPSKNIANDYLDMVQNNPSRQDTINQASKKYNQALSYCYQGSLDLAIIQLKKVLSLSPKYVQAHQLLALLYLNAEQWEDAKRELEKCKKIDINNVRTLRYLNEVDTMLSMGEDPSKTGGKKKADTVKYRHGNETIIQPLNHKESKNTTTLFNILLGIVIGIAASCFLILPARIQNAKQGIDEKYKEVSEQLDAKTATITQLEQNIKSLTAQKEDLEQEIHSYVGEDGQISVFDSLLKAVDVYLQTPQDLMKVDEYLNQIDEESLDSYSESFRLVYQFLHEKAGEAVGKVYYDTGMAAYQNDEFEDAINDLSKAFSYDNTNGEALYNLGHAYRKSGDKQNALETYKKVIELFPNTEKASRSQSYINDLNSQ